MQQWLGLARHIEVTLLARKHHIGEIHSGKLQTLGVLKKVIRFEYQITNDHRGNNH